MREPPPSFEVCGKVRELAGAGRHPILHHPDQFNDWAKRFNLYRRAIDVETSRFNCDRDWDECVAAGPPQWAVV